MTYREASQFYDLFGSKNDLEFYRHQAVQAGNTALELGVGTARVAISMARSGINVTGLDNSPHMLEIARQKIAIEALKVKERVKLVEGDMRDFQLNQLFSLIYIPASSFNHNLSREDQKRTLVCIWQHLKPTGTLAFDLDVVSLKSESSWWIDRKQMDTRMVVRTGFVQKKQFERIVSLNLFFDVYEHSKLVERYHEYGDVALISHEEIVPLLKETGFRNIKLYGDFDRSEYTANSLKLVITANKG